MGQALSLLSWEDAGDPRWREISWLLRFRVAYGKFCWGNLTESVGRFAVLIAELEESRLSLWPYTEEATLRWWVTAYLWWGVSTLHLGRYEEARHLAEQCLAYANQSDVPSARWQGLILLADVLIWTGNGPQAAMHLQECLRIAREHGMKYHVAVSFELLGLAWAEQGNYMRSRACSQRTLAWSRESGQRLGMGLQNLGGAELALGNLAEARRSYRQAMRLHEETKTPVDLAVALTGLARVALAMGDGVEARAHLRRGLQMLEGLDATVWVINALATVAELSQAEGQAEIAAELCAALLSWPGTPPYAPDTMQHLRLELEMRLHNLAAQLPPGVFAAATSRGRNHEVDDALALARVNCGLN